MFTTDLITLRRLPLLSTQTIALHVTHLCQSANFSCRRCDLKRRRLHPSLHDNGIDNRIIVKMSLQLSDNEYD